MIIRSPELEVKILIDRDPIKTSFEEWARPGHFSKTIYIYIKCEKKTSFACLCEKKTVIIHQFM
jgi:hypothetical protein